MLDPSKPITCVAIIPRNQDRIYASRPRIRPRRDTSTWASRSHRCFPSTHVLGPARSAAAAAVEPDRVDHSAKELIGPHRERPHGSLGPDQIEDGSTHWCVRSKLAGRCSGGLVPGVVVLAVEWTGVTMSPSDSYGIPAGTIHDPFWQRSAGKLWPVHHAATFLERHDD